MKGKMDQFIITKVREMRIEKGISQAQLANEPGMPVGFIGKVESMKYASQYSIRNLNQLAKVFGCSPQDFVPEKPI